VDDTRLEKFTIWRFEHEREARVPDKIPVVNIATIAVIDSGLMS